ncbi:MAG TPA: MOSC domain-containing protein [Segeticoccus sp.]|uniref:MOSC domain-containing protein n=1 Tax=Segeticoccus sp. TaxID=2706531 RepID=UPI002D7F8FA3|nr:MOSC domain-containing protein [Segeticoccus sp.]HET8601790.1 MOSC domain-containing protein [Segeticoccus sp.]
MADLRLLEIHRYPVKSMLGERLDAVAVDRRGLVGDRLWAVRADDGKFASGKHSRRFRRMDPVFAWSAALAPDEDGAGGPTAVVTGPDGRAHRCDDRALPDALTASLGRPVHLVREGQTRRDGQVLSHFDAAAVSIVGTATLAAAAELVGAPETLDPRRFRANLVVETEEPWIEEDWVGRRVDIGDVSLVVTERIPRCRMVDIRQGDVPERPGVLKTLTATRGMCLAVYAEPLTEDTVRVGDPVRC